MQSHSDKSHDASAFLRALKAKADEMAASGQSTIAAGRNGEVPLAEWEATNGMFVRHMPDDEHDILRISVGGGDSTPVILNYCTIQGPVGRCIAQLEMAIAALRECPE